MVHPAAVAIALGIGIGAAIFLIYQQNFGTNYNRQHSYERERRDPFEGLRHQIDNDKCSICLENLDDTESKRLECRHRFHKSCIEQSLRYSSSCPNCRRPARI